ncbi:Cytochrome P450 [Corchorus olitorius]|uniref:Cytochrome P450 n=1 Tax=Corchorus olitorius TaxID=93759 RepID=A0A1R3HIF4_9ROSI|nr:Cytochrome P450 [Corchorus olitorius]
MLDLQDYILLFLIWLVTIILFRTILIKWRGKPRLPPSPRALPIIGHMHLLGPIPHQALTKLANRYGPLIYFYIGSKPCVLVSSHELAKEVFKNNETTFLNRPKMANLDYLTYGTADMAMAPYGPLWKFMKKLCMAELLGTRTLDQLLPVRREEMNRFVKIIQEKAEAGEAVDLGVELMRLTNNIISRMLLGKRCSDKEDEANEVQTIVKEMNGLGTKFNLADLIWFCKNLDLQGYRKRLKDVRDRYDILMEKIILEHKEARKNGAGADKVKDVLDILINISEDENAEMKLSRENIKAFVMNQFLDVRGQHFSLLPFGSGRRSCPGASLALQVVPTVLGIVIQCFDWKVDGENGTVNMDEKPGMTLLRAHPLICRPVVRLSPFPSL